MRVMRRVKLMLQPGGSKLGYDLPDEALATMTDQEKQRYEQDLIMRGLMANSMAMSLKKAAMQKREE